MPAPIVPTSDTPLPTTNGARFTTARGVVPRAPESTLDLRQGSLLSFLDPDPARSTPRGSRDDVVKTHRTGKYPLGTHGWQAPVPGSATRPVNARRIDAHMQANAMHSLTDPAQGGVCVALDLRHLEDRTASAVAATSSAVTTAASAARLCDGWYIYIRPLRLSGSRSRLAPAPCLHAGPLQPRTEPFR